MLWYYPSLLLLSLLLPGYCIEPFTTAAIGTAAVAGAITAGTFLMCQVQECCTDKWTRHNISELEVGFQENLFGQQIVSQVIPRAIKNHVENENPGKALVLVFDGWTGSGKNFVSDLIIEHLYKSVAKSGDSRYIYKWIASKDFLHQSKVEEYQMSIKETVMQKTKICERSLFVIDEMDKMPEHVTDILKPFLDHHRQIEGINFRKNIFIFLSNTAGDIINKEMRKHFNQGLAREEMQASHMENVLKNVMFNVHNGLKNSTIIKNHLVDFFVPFLPLEREHVINCALAEMRRRGKQQDRSVAELAADQLTYVGNMKFSTTGCKLVAKKLDMFL